MFSLGICHIIFCISTPSIVLITYTYSTAVVVLIKPNPQCTVFSRDGLVALFLFVCLFPLFEWKTLCSEVYIYFLVYVVFKPKLTFQAIRFQDRGLYIVKQWILVVSVKQKRPSGLFCARLLGEERSPAWS